jgi:hypothetical protein
MSRPQNSILSALSRKAYLSILPGLAPVELAFGRVLYEPGDAIPDVYFPGRSVFLLYVIEADDSFNCNQ